MEFFFVIGDLAEREIDCAVSVVISTGCIRSIHGLYGGNTHFCELFLTARVKLRLNLSNIIGFAMLVL